MRYSTTFAVVAVLAAACAGCESFPGGSPRCPGANFRVEPYDHNGDNQYDGIRGILEYKFVIACSIPGDEVGVLVSTQVVNGARCYRVEVTDGPAAGTIYKAVDVYDAISAMDQILIASGYSMSYQETSDYRDAWKTWFIDNWISADDFHTNTGY